MINTSHFYVLQSVNMCKACQLFLAYCQYQSRYSGRGAFDDGNHDTSGRSGRSARARREGTGGSASAGRSAPGGQLTPGEAPPHLPTAVPFLELIV